MGSFAQTNGTHTINGNLYLGKESGSFGDFDLSFADPQNPDSPTPPGVGLLDVHGFASVGYLGEGSFSQDGGTVKIRGIDQEVNLRGKSLSTTLSKGALIKLQPTAIYWFYGRARGNRRSMTWMTGNFR